MKEAFQFSAYSVDLEGQEHTIQRKNSLYETDGSINMRKLSKDIMDELLVIPDIKRPEKRFIKKSSASCQFYQT